MFYIVPVLLLCRVTLCKTPGCFLPSLSNPGNSYSQNFKQKKEELTSRLYQLYNTSVFDNKVFLCFHVCCFGHLATCLQPHTHVFFLFCCSQLPANMQVTWNKKMRKTAGYCITGQERAGGSRYARIELSEKVCDSSGIAPLQSSQSGDLQPYVCNATFVMLDLMCRSPQGHAHP